MKTRNQKTSSSAADRTREYAEAVVSGSVVAGPHVRNACQRHLLDLENGHERGLRFDHDAAVYAFEFYETVLMLSEGQFEGKPFELHPSQAFIVGSIFGWKREDNTRRFRRAYIEQGKGNGKPLAIDTPIATPSGWTTMGALSVGDQVFDELGQPRSVVAVSEVMTGRPCYQMRFSDGCEIVAEAGHEWLTTTLRSGRKRGDAIRGVPRAERKVTGRGSVGLRTTAEIAATITAGETKSLHPQAKWNHRIEVAQALALPTADLPIPPYTLGAWLGDGDSAKGHMTAAFADIGVVSQIAADGFLINERKPRRPSTGRFKIEGLNGLLREAGLINNKHIPLAYLRGSQSQRLALLQGLADTDGFVSKGQAQCEITTILPRLRDGIMELIRSLGMKPTCMTARATLYGKDCGEAYRIQFAAGLLPVFRLPRKLGRLRPPPPTRAISRGRMIVACDPVPSVPVRCIQVDGPSHLFLAGEGMVPTHNSPLAGGLGLLGLAADGEAGAQIYAAAAKREQAGILFADAVKMVKQSPALKKRLEFSGGPGREFNIAHHPSGSFFRAVSRDTGKTGSGPRPYFVLADEVHELPDRKILEMLERGFKFRRQPLLFMITNSGSDRNTVAWEEHEHAVKVAAGNREAVNDPTFIGEPLDDTTFSYVCSLDDGEDPLEDPSCWAKANPLLGVTITDQYLADVVAQAKSIPGQLNGILRLHFCMWTDAATAWMSRSIVEAAQSDFSPKIHKGKPAHVGLDLSQNRDITAMATVVQTGTNDEGKPTFDAWVEAWTPGDTYRARELRDKLPYSVWVNEGHLNAPTGESISYRHVAQTLAEYANELNVKVVAYDRYAFKRFEEDVDEIGLKVAFAEHPQGGLKKGKPLQEGKEGLWMPGSCRLLEDALLEGRIRLKRNPVLISAMMSAVIEEDKWGNHWLSKARSINKIDAAVALAMAFGAAHAVAEKQKRFQMLVFG